MKNSNFTPRHQKLIKLKNDIEVLKLGQRNREYIELIETLRQKVIEELKIEQRKVGLIPPNKKENIFNG